MLLRHLLAASLPVLLRSLGNLAASKHLHPDGKPHFRTTPSRIPEGKCYPANGVRERNRRKAQAARRRAPSNP